MWYVVQVETGREEAAASDIAAAAPDVVDECFVPRFSSGKRTVDGQWKPVDERLIPGYVICSTKHVSDVADRLRAVKGLTRILGNDNAFIPLDDDERAWVQRATRRGERTVGESVGFMDDGKLVVVDGPLVGREAWVAKVSHRKRLAFLELPMGGRKVRAQAGLRMVSKAQGMQLLREQ